LITELSALNQGGQSRMRRRKGWEANEGNRDTQSVRKQGRRELEKGKMGDRGKIKKDRN